MIVETDASEKGYGDILKQKINRKESLVCFHSGVWNNVQQNYSTIKNEFLAIVLFVQKFQGDLIDKEFLVITDSKASINNCLADYFSREHISRQKLLKSLSAKKNAPDLRPSSIVERPPPPLSLNQPNPATPQPASSSRASSSKGKHPISQVSALTPMCADNYAVDLSFQTISRHRQGSLRRNLTIGSTPDTLTTLLRPTSAATSNRPTSKPKSYARMIKPSIFMPRPLVTRYQTKTILEDVVIELEFDGPSIPEICSQVYPHGFNFFPEDIKKTRQFYEFILIDSF
ncbi:Enzymatic polyprotein [Cucumis melo var. makuwa]|uniref:Enzymatic polyprotein n=1 Tax=Cucumis melo var. makuwa TaxID=1194695 RepID=A0A5D3C8L0_CUCMM|nr:Enzymatic polyprotein [Cucumis melo var. makuwa]